ncbi:unnamed protein product [Gongylonema pulchrum]|uniref:Uncharacterized protein n=1 Tax=Gongylonema pulchrum TaxID=637853 RepID=A0A183E9G1_9BILA|nr:unnamed protein product [Gongylonema pulchrum]
MAPPIRSEQQNEVMEHLPAESPHCDILDFSPFIIIQHSALAGPPSTSSGRPDIHPLAECHDGQPREPTKRPTASCCCCSQALVLQLLFATEAKACQMTRCCAKGNGRGAHGERAGAAHVHRDIAAELFPRGAAARLALAQCRVRVPALAASLERSAAGRGAGHPRAPPGAAAARPARLRAVGAQRHHQKGAWSGPVVLRIEGGAWRVREAIVECARRRARRTLLGEPVGLGQKGVAVAVAIQCREGGELGWLLLPTSVSAHAALCDFLGASLPVLAEFALAPLLLASVLVDRRTKASARNSSVHSVLCFGMREDSCALLVAKPAIVARLAVG